MHFMCDSNFECCRRAQLIEERSLTLARRMHVAEKAWAKLAKHFALRVTEADSAELQQAAELVARYRAIAEELWAAVVAREADLVGTAAASKVPLLTALVAANSLLAAVLIVRSLERARKPFRTPAGRETGGQESTGWARRDRCNRHCHPGNHGAQAILPEAIPVRVLFALQ